MDEITQRLYRACKAALPHFTNPKSLVGHQLRAAIEMAEADHTPRRPLAEFLGREAAAVGTEKTFLNPAGGSHWAPDVEPTDAPKEIELVRHSPKNAAWHKDNDAAAFNLQIQTQDLGAQS